MPEKLVETVPGTPAELGLPPKFTDWRQAQTIAAMRITNAFNRGKKFVFLEAPPGIGKTPLAVLLDRMISRPRDVVGKYPVAGTVITTMTKLLQQQYLDDFPDQVSTATGRDNWPCLIDEKNTAANAACTHGWECPVQRLCPYIQQRDVADLAQISVLNSTFYTYERAHTSKFAGHDLGIFDEAHELERTLLSFGAVWISPKLFERLGYPMPNSLEFHEGSAWDVFWHAYHEKLDEDQNEAEDALEDAVELLKEQGHIDLSANNGHLLGKVRDFKTIHNIFHALSIARKNPEQYVLQRKDQGALELSPIWGRAVAFHWPQRVVLMSGTILAPEFLAYCLNIPDGEWEMVRMPSEFAATSRPLWYIPTVKMSAKVTDQDLNYLVHTIDQIIEHRHLGQKGIIHSVSYKLRDEIMMRSKHAGMMMTHNAQDRIMRLEQFRTMPDGWIMVSPSMTTGVDLPADQCRWQIIPKMPFPNRGDEVIRLRMEDQTPFDWAGRQVKLGDIAYAYATATPLIQAYGRAMRSHDDWGHTYVLDNHFWHFQHENRWGPLFPSWFKEAIRYTSLEELLAGGHGGKPM